MRFISDRTMAFVVGLVGLTVALVSVPWSVSAVADASIWTSRTSSADNSWKSVTYGNGLFVAVSANGAGNQIMTSPDGITWTSRSPVASIVWKSVTYGNGLFVAIGSSFDTTSPRVMTSPDGINWTGRTDPFDQSWSWESVTFGNGVFVALNSNHGSADFVMTSPDGITWTSRTTPPNNWISVTYGNGRFVAVATAGPGPRVMTSPDGITWTSQTAASNISWSSVTYGNGQFVAVANFGSGPSGVEPRVMTSPDGITWTSQTVPLNPWNSVTYGDGLFVAVAYGGTNRVMTSPDGVTWTSHLAAAANDWTAVTYGDGLFVAVSESGTGDRVMTSGTFVPPPTTPPTSPPTTPTTSTPSSVDIDLPNLRFPSLASIQALPTGSNLLPSEFPRSPGETITVSSRGFTPGEYVQLVVALPLRVIGFGYANAQGEVTLSGTLPLDLDSDVLTLAVYAPVSKVGVRQSIVLTSPALPQTE